MKTDFNTIIPQGVLFNLKEIEGMNIIKIDMAKKLVLIKQLEVIKVGRKIHISRAELIRYLESRTVRALY